MPSDDHETGKWIRDVFEAKEQELTKFYDDDANTFDGEVLDGTYRARKIGMALSMLFWPLMTYLWIYLCRNFTLVFYHQIAMVLIYTIQPWWSGGLEFFIAVVTNLFKRTAVKQKKA